MIDLGSIRGSVGVEAGVDPGPLRIDPEVLLGRSGGDVVSIWGRSGVDPASMWARKPGLETLRWAVPRLRRSRAQQ